ncbi:MAG: hypothetical protein UR50_C0008G0005 [Parcubacteria group bacterium GW2011_GWC1_34_10]|nr:MAG: hypothetical protein UR50_C0008G0005 [Parcubacteria group bacterium GW2011_GWC1_34_10]
MQNALFGVVIVGLVVVIFLLLRKKEVKSEDNGLKLLLEQMNNLSRTVDQKLGESSKLMHESVQSQFGNSQKLIKEITEELTHVKDTGRRVEGFAEQLKSLQDILKNPKQRGVLGEYYLETLLKNVLPPGSYQMQYPFPDGTIVDAAVFVKDKVIPVDSKFSLENYNRMAEANDPTEKKRLAKVFEEDLKKRIVETSKYIQPDKGTTEFAFMFIPHEAIYYDLLVNTVGAVSEDSENLIQRAAGKYHVIIVSPTSFLAYLQTVLQGLSKLGNALSTTVNHYNKTNQSFKLIDKDVMRITGEAPNLEIESIEKPDIDD